MKNSECLKNEMSVLLNLLCVQNVYVLNEDQLLLFFIFILDLKPFYFNVFSALIKLYYKQIRFLLPFSALFKQSIHLLPFFKFFFFLDLIGFVVNGFAWSKQRCTFRIFAPLKSISKWILLFAQKRFSIN